MGKHKVEKSFGEFIRKECADCHEAIGHKSHYILVEGKGRTFWHKSCVYSFIIEGKGKYRW